MPALGANRRRLLVESSLFIFANREECWRRNRRHQSRHILFAKARDGLQFIVQAALLQPQVFDGPFCQFGATVVCNGKCGGFRTRQRGPHDADFLPSQRLRGGVRAVAGADDALGVHHDGLLLAEALQRRGDAGEILIGVASDVGRVGVD